MLRPCRRCTALSSRADFGSWILKSCVSITLRPCCLGEALPTNRDKIAALLDERFCRMWEFYLIAVEMGFRSGKQMVFQLQLAKSLDVLPITRDYMAEAELCFRRFGCSPSVICSRSADNA